MLTFIRLTCDYENIFQDEMPHRADIRTAIEDAVQAQNMEKGVRLMTFSFSTRYDMKSARLDNATSTCTGLQISKEDYTAGDLVWVKRTGYPRFSLVLGLPSFISYNAPFSEVHEKDNFV
ncbi:hypothetical protein AVEN_125275-1 [Araneus ventricosus]|uniref:Uncharacterized protein n=1 Tax=Araneus ventricosus TaxID=182803 RepID=A0A4Y2UD80_ARAVE|nr:hypothetical protein AVEN_125275-1 [Araneus ventricosus]